MSREWQPGDVAMVTYRLGECTETNLCAKTDKGWDCLAPGVGFLMHGDVYEARPLVVIDPEDAKQVERLAQLVPDCGDPVNHCDPKQCLSLGCWTDRVQQALREFANPKSPKPDEPTGLGAVVRDAAGEVWVRADGGNHLPWTAGTTDGASRWSGYERLDVVEVLSEGVTP